MPRSLSVPHVDHEQFESPPLKAMLGQVQFPPILRVADMAYLAPFQEAIAGQFPEFAEEQQVSLMVGPEGVLQSGAGKAYRFASADRSWSIVLSPTALTLEAAADRYTSYAEFRGRFEEVWEAARAHLRPTRRVQQGLRYIDHIERELSSAGWAEWIRPELLGVVGQPELSDHVLQSLADVRLKLSSGIMSFKHGIVQAGPEGKWGYMLDFDYFRQQESDDTGTESVLEQFDVFHEEIYALFRWCVTPKALETFRRGN